jgi:hypothetical protein
MTNKDFKEGRKVSCVFEGEIIEGKLSFDSFYNKWYVLPDNKC